MPGPEVANANGVPEESERFIDKIDPEDPEYKRELMRPADIKEDVKLMEQRKRVSLILNSEAFRRELEEIIESQLRSGPHPASLVALQQISELLLPHARYGSSAFSRGASAPTLPVNDVRAGEATMYERGERLLRCKLASVYRLVDMFGWTQHGFSNHITARVGKEHEHFLVNPSGLFYHEITAASLVKVDTQGNVIDPGSTLLAGPGDASFRQLHVPIYAARPDTRCVLHLSTPALAAVSSLRAGLLPLSREALLVGPVLSTTAWAGSELSRDEITSSSAKVIMVRGQGVLVCGDSVEETWQLASRVVLACEAQLRLGPNVDPDKLVLPSEEDVKKAYEMAVEAEQQQAGVTETGHKWQRGELEFEGLMRHLDNAGYRTGYIYHQPIVKMERRQRRHEDVEVPPASSSFAYYHDGDELDGSKLASAQKKLADKQKAAQRTEWLTTPNAYNKEEIEETGTAKPKKYTRWVPSKPEEGGPSGHATPIHNTNQFAPQGQNPRELKEQQKKVKSKYYKDDISAGPQSKILEGLSDEEVRKLIEEGRATYSGDHVVMVGAASKGIIQREHQHNAAVYKDVYSPNPFNRVTDDDLDAYRQTVERKNKGEDEPAAEVQVNVSGDGVSEPAVSASAASTEKAEAGSPEHLSPPKSDTLRSDTSGQATSHDEGDTKSPTKEDKKKKKGFRMPSFSKKKEKK